MLEVVSRKISLRANLSLGRFFGLGHWVLEVSFVSIESKEEEKHFPGLPLGGVLPRIGAYILCTLSLCDLLVYGNYLMNKIKDVIKEHLTSQVIIKLRKISYKMQVFIFSNICWTKLFLYKPFRNILLDIDMEMMIKKIGETFDISHALLI